MQTFKQIPYQNYIQLKFNNRNLNQAQKQQALIKYKRNAQLLAQIFSFRKVQNQQFKTQNNISEGKILLFRFIRQIEQLQQFRKQVQEQKRKGEEQINRVKAHTQLYEEKLKSIKEINTVQDLQAKIQELKAADLYDEKHPFFVKNSPFYLNTTEQEILEVKMSAMDEQISAQGLNLLQM